METNQDTSKLIQSACRDRIGLEETKETVETMETTADTYMQIQNCMKTERPKETKETVETVETRYTCKYKIQNCMER